MLTEEDNAVRWRNTLEHGHRSSSSEVARRCFEPWCRTEPRSRRRDECVCWARVVRKIRVCLTDTRGSFSSDNNSLMNVCARKGIRAAAAMNCETHQSRYWSDLKQQSDRDKHRSDVRNGKASSCSDGGRLPPRMFSGLIIEGLLPLIICSTSVHLKSIWII